MLNNSARALWGSRLLIPILAVLFFAVTGSAQSPAVVFNGQTFRLTGWADAGKYPEDRLAGFLSVSVDAPDVPALGGAYHVENGDLIFVPRYPLSAGMRYRAEVRLPSREPIVKTFDTPKADQTPTTFVERIYPSINVFPENQLKLYIHFSAAMSRGEAYEHIYLLDSNGQRVEHPFLELGEELWDPEGKRLTVFFDPGRIKSGLVPHNELGMPVEEGKSYTLVVNREFHDAERKLLKNPFTKAFRVGPADRKPLDVSAWRLTSPKANTSDAITLEFPEPLDHALLESQLEVLDSNGNPVRGSVDIDRDETRWKFVPAAFWTSGAYSVQIGAIIEDLAGNKIDRPFEVDVFNRVEQDLTRETRIVRFSVQ